jgi:penicillin-binding protein 1B
MKNFLSTDLGIAGKTGTTDNFRDSWFAGFTENRVAVVWIGRDDNQSTGLTGASGAMTVWGEMMAQLNPQPLTLAEPDRIEYHWIDRPTGKLSGSECKDAIYLPFISGSAPTEQAACGPKSHPSAIRNWLKRIFQ